MASRTATRASELAAQLEAVNSAIVDEVSGCTDEQWQSVTASEGWPVGVVAHHVSEVQRFFSGVVAGFAAGETSLPSLTSQDVDENNAAHARQFAGVGKTETLDALRENGSALTRLVGGLDEVQLERAAFAIDGHELNGEQIVELGMVNHFREHLASIRAAVED